MITAKDINSLRKSIRAWKGDDKDAHMVKVYANDREDLGRLLDAIEDGDIKLARQLADSLDTLVRDQIPTTLYDKIQRQAEEEDEEADPNADEFRCEACGKKHDIEDSVRDKRTRKLYCVACADEPRVPKNCRE
jgi:hypothetical protein